jgi:excisionase family DNA binding protein
MGLMEVIFNSPLEITMELNKHPKDASGSIAYNVSCVPALPCIEPLITIPEACATFNLRPHVLRRAIKAGAIPSYRLVSRRILLRASDINAAIEASKTGGQK